MARMWDDHTWTARGGGRLRVKSPLHLVAAPVQKGVTRIWKCPDWESEHWVANEIQTNLVWPSRSSQLQLQSPVSRNLNGGAQIGIFQPLDLVLRPDLSQPASKKAYSGQ